MTQDQPIKLKSEIERGNEEASGYIDAPKKRTTDQHQQALEHFRQWERFTMRTLKLETFDAIGSETQTACLHCWDPFEEGQQIVEHHDERFCADCAKKFFTPNELKEAYGSATSSSDSQSE